MRNEILAAVLVVLVVGSLGIGYVVGGIYQTAATSTLTVTATSISTATRTATVYSSFTTSILLDFSCSAPYTGTDGPSDSPNRTSGIFPIISVPHDHAAVVLCVTYYDNDKNKTLTVDLNGTLQVGLYKSFFLSGCPGGERCNIINFTSSPDFEIISNVTSIKIGGNASSAVTVAYDIIPKGGSPGFYWMSIGYLFPAVCSNEFPFAYGYSFTASNASLRYFPLPSGFAQSCIVVSPSYYLPNYPFTRLVGVSGDVMVTEPNETATYKAVST